jgi:hypothetical protein
MNHTRSSTKKTATAFAALFALLALAAGTFAAGGCGASATLDPIARAAEITSTQPGVRFTLTTQMTSPALPSGSFSITGKGYMDERNRSGEITMDLSGLPGASSLPEGSLGEIQALYKYPVIYMHMPFLASRLPESKTWIKIDLSAAAAAGGANLGGLSSLSESNPSRFIEYLRASSGGVVKLGSETVDGVPCTHYHGALQLGAVLERLPSSDQAAAKAALEKLGTDGTIPVNVWVDAQGRLRRIQLSLSASPSGTPASGAPPVSGTVTVDYTAYGPVPPVVPPPAGEVFDASSLAASALAGSQTP